MTIKNNVQTCLFYEGQPWGQLN